MPHRRLEAVLLVALCLAVPWPTPATGAEASAETAEEEELAELLAILEEETEVATRSRMNSDFVPGIVTVLQGDELEALGKRTVWEALSLVPGVEAVRDNNGATSMVVRGTDFPFNSGNVKIMVDSVSLSRQSAGMNGAVLLMPIEMVERIEVIRGPGSVIYGDFAFMGLVNVVTRKRSTRLHAVADSESRLQAGALVSLGDEEDDDGFRFTANLSGFTADDAAVREPLEGEEDRGFGVVTVARGGFSLSAQVADRSADDTTPEPRPPGPALAFDQTSWATEARYQLPVGDRLETELVASVVDTEIGNGPNRFDDRVVRLGAELGWELGDSQSWFAGLEYSSSEIDRAVSFRPPPMPVPGQGPPPPPGSLVVEGAEREIVSITLQDQIELDRVSVTVGVRYDDYDDIGDRFTPRLSLVWRATEHHILKAQYAEGFRAPTFFELYAPDARLNSSLDFEVNETTELNYVYRRAGMVGRVTLFHTEIEDMVFPTFPEFIFSNSRRAEADGVEVEWSQQLTDRLKVMANGSWVETEDGRTRSGVGNGEADWLANLAVLFRPTAHTLAALHWNHVGDRQAHPMADAYDLVDATFSVDDLLGSDLGLRLGVDNVLDDEVFYVASRPDGVSVVGYADQTAWVQLSWRP